MLATCGGCDPFAFLVMPSARRRSPPASGYLPCRGEGRGRLGGGGGGRVSAGPKPDPASLRAGGHIFSASGSCPLPYGSAPAAMYFSQSEAWAPTSTGERARQRRATASRVIGTRG